MFPVPASGKGKPANCLPSECSDALDTPGQKSCLLVSTSHISGIARRGDHPHRTATAKRHGDFRLRAHGQHGLLDRNVTYITLQLIDREGLSGDDRIHQIAHRDDTVDLAPSNSHSLAAKIS